MSNANPQHEPTMEEILASIRKIISEDQPEAAAPAPQAAPPLAAVRAVAPEAASAMPEPEADVLELTEELPEEEEPVMPISAAPENPIENDIVFENIDMEPTPEPAPDDDLISDNTRNAVGRAVASLDRRGPDLPSLSGGTVEAIFVRAVQDAFVPTLQDWVGDHREEIIEQLKPMIRSWMDEHLPRVIEAVVTKEIGRVAGAPRPPHRR